jgi:hypothetical protein
MCSPLTPLAELALRRLIALSVSRPAHRFKLLSETIIASPRRVAKVYR